MKAISVLRNRKFLVGVSIFIASVFFTLLVKAIVPPDGVELHKEFITGKSYGSKRAYVENEILVKFRKGISLAEIDKYAGSMQAKVKKHYKAISRIKGQEYVLLQSEKKAAAMMLLSMKKAPDVDFAVPNYRVHICANEPNDPRFYELWGLHNTGQTGGTADIDIDALEVWERIGRTARVIVAVIDTGINYNHPDLAANIWVNPGEIAGNGIDDEGNGYIDDIHGINAITGSGDPLDDNGHGTHCAGILGAVGNNGLEVSGVNWNTKIIGTKAMDVTGSGDDAYILACFDYIIDLKTIYNQKIVAINASFGGNSYSQVVKDAVDAAGEAGIVLCVAAGNSGTNIDNEPFYPACYSSANIITVTAIDHSGQQFYNYGAASVDLAAPGVNILSTVSWYFPQPGDIFFDDMESGPGNWVTGGTNNTWAITTNQEGFANSNYPVPSPPHFWSDSPGVNYAPNTNSWLMNKRDIDLSGYTNRDAYIGFSAAMVIEDIFDHARIEVSGDSGKTWASIVDFTGYGIRWQTGYYFLIPTAVKTEHFRFRFRLKSDGEVEEWGWLLDDIGVGDTITFGSELQSGTSMAAPYVTGVAAFIAALYPSDTLSQRIERILDNVVPLDSLSGKCVTGGLLNLDLAVGDPPPITVTYPSGGETFTIGKQIPIEWSSWGFTGDVKIFLKSTDLTNTYLITRTAAYDSIPYEYTIPCNIPAGSYFISIEKEGIGDGKSGDFTINTGSCITVSDPSGGETYYPGDQMNIAWDTWGISGDVKISLIRSDLTRSYYITNATPYDSSPFQYTIPVGINAGSHYIGIKKPDEAFGKSAEFTIKPGTSSITVIRPMAGEIYHRGNRMSIEWTTTGITGNVIITLKRSDGSGEYTITPATRYNNSPFNYRIPANVLTADYEIEIRQGPVYGLSGNFTIN